MIIWEILTILMSHVSSTEILESHKPPVCITVAISSVTQTRGDYPIIFPVRPPFFPLLVAHFLIIPEMPWVLQSLWSWSWPCHYVPLQCILAARDGATWLSKAIQHREARSSMVEQGTQGPTCHNRGTVLGTQGPYVITKVLS